VKDWVASFEGIERVYWIGCAFPPMTDLGVDVKKLLSLLVLACAMLAFTAPASYACDGGSYNSQSGAGK
jgi:hypothetical protein